MSASCSVTSPVPRAEWESMLRSDENAVVTQSLPPRDALLASGRYQDVSALYEFSSGRRVLMPMARSRWEPPWAARVSSWPGGWAAGGPITQGGPVTPAEAAAVLADVTRRGTLAAYMMLQPQADQVWLSEGARYFKIAERGWYLLDLSGGFEHVWQHKFRRVTRKAVRKAERSGVQIDVDRSGRLLGVVSDLYEKNVRQRAASRNQPVWFMRRQMSQVSPSDTELALVARHFGQDCATWVARFEGQPAAALVVLRSGPYAKAWAGGLDRAPAAQAGASEMLYQVIIEEACLGLVAASLISPAQYRDHRLPRSRRNSGGCCISVTICAPSGFQFTLSGSRGSTRKG